ncbi:MAG: ROK family protein [Endomicrobiia bacterium]
MKQNYVLGIDIGGSEVKFGVVRFTDNNFELLKVYSISTLKGKQNIDIMLRKILDEIVYIKDKFRNISCCGVGVAGIVDHKKGVVIMAPNVMWANFNLKKFFEEKIKLPVIIDNDANVASVGIYYSEILKKYPETKNIICFTLGTGIGGSVIVDREVLHGWNTSATEFGHITIDPYTDKKCGCGNYGCLERFIGARWFVNNISEEIKNNKVKTLISELVNNDLSKITAEIVYKSAVKKDKFAIEQWKVFGKYLGIAVGNLINIFNPQVVVFTGGVAKAYRFFLPYVKKEVKLRLWPEVKFNKKYSLSDNVKYYICLSYKNYGVLGAAILAYNTYLL